MIVPTNAQLNSNFKMNMVTQIMYSKLTFLENVVQRYFLISLKTTLWNFVNDFSCKIAKQLVSCRLLFIYLIFVVDHLIIICDNNNEIDFLNRDIDSNLDDMIGA